MRQTRRNFVKTTALVPLAFAISAPLMAQEDPMATMQSLAQYTIQTVGNKQYSLAQRRQYATQVIDQRFNTDKLGKLALGNIRKRISPAEMTAFLAKFRELMIEDFIWWFSDFDGSAWKVVSAKRGAKDANTVFFDVEYRRPNGTMVNTNWRAISESGVYKVLDIKVAGLSLLSDLRGKYRSEYSSGKMRGVMRFMDSHIRKRRKQLGG